MFPFTQREIFVATAFSEMSGFAIRDSQHFWKILSQIALEKILASSVIYRRFLEAENFTKQTLPLS